MEVVITGATVAVVTVETFIIPDLMISVAFVSILTICGWRIFDTVAVSVAIACCSIVRGGRLGIARSGKGLVGAFPYWNDDDISVGVSLSFSPLPVDPTSVTELKFEGEVGALGTSVSALPEVETDVFVGTPRKPSSCGALLISSIVSSASVLWIIVTEPSVVVLSGIQDKPTSSTSVVDCC